MFQSRWILRLLTLAAPILGVACDGGGPIDPGTLRFGQVGGIKLTVVAPLALGLGEMEQILTWTSDGRWGVEEEVRYKGIVGDASTQRLEGSSDALANTYAQWITDANDNPGLKLFVDGLDPDLDPSCAVIHSRVTLEISDTPSGQSESWTRCVPGFLQSLTPFGALPDPGAPRVANLARLARDYTVGESFESAYEGTQPFATLDKGEDTPSGLSAPTVINDAPSFEAFWAIHAPGQMVPPVDFAEETVVVASRGERREAGDSLEVRAVKPAGPLGTVVTLVQRVPGDFCSPAEVTHVPFHIIVTPRVPQPVSFQTPVLTELVDCG
jgi:hypothetical protein